MLAESQSGGRGAVQTQQSDLPDFVTKNTKRMQSPLSRHVLLFPHITEHQKRISDCVRCRDTMTKLQQLEMLIERYKFMQHQKNIGDESVFQHAMKNLDQTYHLKSSTKTNPYPNDFQNLKQDSQTSLEFNNDNQIPRPKLPFHITGCGSPVVKVSDHGWHVMSSSPVPLKTHCVEQQCTIDLLIAETSSRWWGGS
ncbi:hypothetical protein TNCV_3279871 [Trichonephila clavipes]|nr:hypothetical protein TNCV_3279871 [Trichonephila clavipes]